MYEMLAQIKFLVGDEDCFFDEVIERLDESRIFTSSLIKIYFISKI